MSVRMTEQQRQAVECRGASLIVSAAAGAGKTAVLTRRVLELLTDPRDPCDVDRLLVLTFTNAAAGEMRQRIGDQLRHRLAERPDDRNLRRQLAMLGTARIQTVHAFCQSLIRRHFTLCRVDPDFRLADEAQCAILLEQALQDTLEEAYGRADPAFGDLCDALTDGRSDRVLTQSLLEIYHRSRSHPDPRGLLENIPRACLGDADGLPWLQQVRREAGQLLLHALTGLEHIAEEARQVEPVWEKYGPLLEGYLDFGQQLRQEMVRSWDGARQLLRSFDKGRLTPCRYEDKAFLQRVQAGRERFLKSIVTLREEYYFQPSAAIEKEGLHMAPMVQALCQLVLELSRRFTREKHSRGLLDFSDLEHYTLELLRNEEVAAELREQFREVLVDEYQDTNDIQEAIFRALRQPGDPAFFVGDIKQSIYRFRLAEPALFAHRYESSRPYAPGLTGDVRLSLNKNFRSRPEVLSLCNAVMSRLMTADFGDVEYDADQRLYAGRAAEGALPCEVLLLDCSDSGSEEESEDRAVLEARLTARRVARILREERVPDGTGSRPAKPEDIAILLSSYANKSPVYRKELQALGIPCGSGGGAFFGTVETSVMLSLLRLLVNRRQDIPLVSVLRSPLYLASPDLLARLRLAAPQGDLIDGLEECADTEPLCRRLLEDLDRWSENARELPPSQLLRMIYDETGAESLFAALDGGLQRRRNLQRLEEMLRPFDTASGGLNAFLHWIDRKLQDGLEPDEPAADASGVQLLSIHRSKGLEWPFVILPDLSKRFNTDDLKRPVLFHPKVGLGLRLRRQDTHGETRTQLQQAITARTRRELRSEELRKLYVAMTRAREKLILVMSDRSISKKVAAVAEETAGSPTPQWMAMQSDAMNWLLAALLTHPACGALRAMAPQALPTAGDSRAEDLICRVLTPDDLTESLPCAPAQEAGDTPAAGGEGEDYRPLVARSRACYPHEAASRLPSKVTPTGLPALLPESGQIFGLPAHARTRDHQPRELERPDPRALLRGTAMHTLLRRADLAACTSKEAVLAQADRLTEEGFLTEEERALILPEPLVAFAASPLARRVLACGKVLREYEFGVLLQADELLEEGPSGEQLLLNGAIDLLLFEQAGMTVIDFKTDRVPAGEEAAQAREHALQLALYARAAQEIFGLPVQEKWVWFLRSGKGVKLP